EHAHKGAVNGVRGTISVRMNADAEVRSVGPVLAALRIDGIGLGLEAADFRQRKGKDTRALAAGHGDVAPGRIREFQTAGVSMDDLAALGLAPAEVGAQPRLPPFRQRSATQTQTKGELVADEAHQTLAGPRSHDQRLHQDMRVKIIRSEKSPTNYELRF